MPQTTGNLKSKKLSLQNNAAGVDYSMSVSASDEFELKRGNEVLLSVAPDAEGVLGDVADEVSKLTVAKDTVFEGDVQVKGNLRKGNYSVPQSKLDKIQAMLDKYTTVGGHFHQQAVVGNASAEEEHHFVSGNTATGVPLEKDNYMRWMSMSKLSGALTLAKCLEEGFVRLDQPLKDFIPELAKENLTVIDPNSIVRDANGAVTGEYTTVPCEVDMTFRHCLEMSSGFGYFFWDWGTIGFYAAADSRNDAISAKMRQDNSKALIFRNIFNDGGDQTGLEDIAERVKYPLMYQPGAESIYGYDYDIMGMALSVAIHASGDNRNAAQYCVDEIWKKCGMNNSWFAGGETQPPADAAQKLAGVYMFRTSMEGSIDAAVEAANPYVGVRPVFSHEVPGDSWNKLDWDYYLKPKNNALTMRGSFGWLGAGPLTDFAKLLKMIANKGKVGNTQVLTGQALSCVVTSPCLSGDMAINFLRTGEYGVAADHPFSTWAGGCIRMNRDERRGFDWPCTPDCLAWGGYYGTGYVLNLEMGNYIVAGSQSPLNHLAYLALPAFDGNNQDFRDCFAHSMH